MVGISVVRDEQDIIEPFVRHNLELLDAMVVVDHGSVDQTHRVLSELASETGRLSVGRLRGFAFDQSLATTTLLHRTQSAFKADFVVPLDADEFVRAESRDALIASFHDIPLGDAGLIPWQTLVMSAEPSQAEADPPRTLRERRAIEKPRYRKIVLRLDGADASPWTLDRGNHNVMHAHRGRVPQHDLPHVQLAHVPIRSAEQVASKEIMGFLSRLSAGLDPGIRRRQLFDRIIDGGSFVGPELRQLCLTYAQDGAAMAIRDDGVWRYRRTCSTGRRMPPLAALARHVENMLAEERASTALPAMSFDVMPEDVAGRLGTATQGATNVSPQADPVVASG